MHARLTLWVMLTVLVVFCVITLILTNATRKALLESSEENAMNRMEIANQQINSVLVGVEVAVENMVPDIEDNLRKPDEMYGIVRQMLELNPSIMGSTIAFEP